MRLRHDAQATAHRGQAQRLGEQRQRPLRATQIGRHGAQDLHRQRLAPEVGGLRQFGRHGKFHFGGFGIEVRQRHHRMRHRAAEAEFAQQRLKFRRIEVRFQRIERRQQRRGRFRLALARMQVDAHGQAHQQEARHGARAAEGLHAVEHRQRAPLVALCAGQAGQGLVGQHDGVGQHEALDHVHAMGQHGLGTRELVALQQRGSQADRVQASHGAAPALRAVRVGKHGLQQRLGALRIAAAQPGQRDEQARDREHQGQRAVAGGVGAGVHRQHRCQVAAGDGDDGARVEEGLPMRRVQHLGRQLGPGCHDGRNQADAVQAGIGAAHDQGRHEGQRRGRGRRVQHGLRNRPRFLGAVAERHHPGADQLQLNACG